MMIFAQIALFALAHASELSAAVSIAKTLLPGAIKLGKVLAPVIHDWAKDHAPAGSSPGTVVDGFLQSVSPNLALTPEQKSGLDADWARAMNRQSAAENMGWNPSNSSFAPAG